MPPVCRGICEEHKASRPFDGKRYFEGQKRCKPCMLFINWEGIWCPCCGCKLRTMPKHTKYRNELKKVRN